MKKTAIQLLLFSALSIFSSFHSITFAQDLNQTDKGGFYFYWGYNRSIYTKSDLHVKGNGYDFTMENLQASDHPEQLDPSVYLNIKKLTIPQFNLRLGYFFKDNWAITAGYDHLKYVMDNHQFLNLNGHIDPGVSPHWSGDYNGQQVQTNDKFIHYENSDGLKYIRFELARYFNLLSVGENNWFRIRAQTAVSAGMILSFNDFNFAGQFDRRTISLSGYGLSLHPGIRLEFFNHIFIQSNASAGFIHQVKVHTRPRQKGSYAKQKFGYLETDLVLGYTWRFNHP